MVNSNLPSTVPEIQHQIAHKLDVAMLNVDRCAQSSNVFSNIIAEDYRPHGAFPSPTLPHEEHLPLLLPLCDIHVGVVGIVARPYYLVSEVDGKVVGLRHE